MGPGCAGGVSTDGARVGDYWERHPNNRDQMESYAPLHAAGDAWSNDGWLGNISDTDIANLSEIGQRQGLWHHY